MFERLRKNAAEATARAFKEEALKSLDELMPTLVGVASVIGLCIGVFGKTAPVASRIIVYKYHL